MKVREICTRQPQACLPSTSLSEAISLMWGGDFGVLPVLDDQRRLVGILTDRDIAVCAGTRGIPASQLTAADAMSTRVALARLDDDVLTALNRMAERRVRRLPVVNDHGEVEGILSLSDIARATNFGPGGKGDAPTPQDLARTLIEIGVPARPTQTAFMPAAKPGSKTA